MSDKLLVSYAPHIRDDESVRDTMLDVLIALVPAFLFDFTKIFCRFKTSSKR